uniref:Thioredoxin domain-containing protein n=1 Tax=viral metagenome TaxID=1070528 RepID=A0A6C0J6V3_9ZZZZ
MEKLIDDFKDKHPEHVDNVRYTQNLQNDRSLYTINDSVHIIDDASLIKNKIKRDYFHGPGILKAYSPTCPHCINKASYIRISAQVLELYNSNAAIYVIDVADNRLFSHSNKISSVPTFYKVTNNGNITDILDIKNITDISAHLPSIESEGL